MSLPAKMVYRLERTTWVEIEVDTAGLIAEWRDEGDTEPWDADDVMETLHQIGYDDLTFSGDFIAVLDKDTDENFQLLSAVSVEGTPQ